MLKTVPDVLVYLFDLETMYCARMSLRPAVNCPDDLRTSDGARQEVPCGHRAILSRANPLKSPFSRDLYETFPNRVCGKESRNSNSRGTA